MKRKHNRAPGQTKISVSLPSEIVRKLDVMAQNDHRSRSNLIAVLINSSIHNHKAA